jgi:DNA polymerase-3 subunit alpha
VEAIVAARQQGGPFRSLDDLCERVDLRKVGKKSLECLIKVGALDAYGERGQLLEAMDQMVGASKARHEAEEVGQLSMFDLFGADSAGASTGFASSLKLPVVEPLTPKQRLEMEKDLLGVYVSSHPLHQMAVDLTGVITCTCGELDDTFVGKGVVLAGNIVRVNQITTKKGDRMAFVTLEDLQGQCDVTIFPRTWEETKAIWQQDKIVVVRGKAEKRGDKLSVLCESVQDYVVRAVAADDSQAIAPLRTAPVFADGNGLRQPVASFRPARARDDDAEFGDDLALAAEDQESPFVLEEPEWLREAPVGRGEESGGWRVESGGWRVESGGWRVESGERRVESGGGRVESGERRLESGIRQSEDSVPTPSTLPSPPSTLRPPREVRVTIQRTADVEKDKKLLSWIYDLLRDRPGRDRFCIVVRKNGGAMQLDFPNDRTELTPALEQQLTRRLGAGSVEVRETAP